MAARTLYTAKFDQAVLGHYTASSEEPVEALCRVELAGPYPSHLLPVTVCPICARSASGNNDHRLVSRMLTT